RNDLRASPSLTAATAAAFQNGTGAPVVPAGASPELILDSALALVMAADALRLACAAGPANAPQLEPRFPEQIASAMFPNLPLPDRIEAVEGLLAGLSAARGASGTAPLPVRAHIIYRNLQGLWVC